MTPNKNNRRWLAQKVSTPEQEYGLSIVTISPEGTYSVEPFVSEIAATTFFNGTITILPISSGGIEATFDEFGGSVEHLTFR